MGQLVWQFANGLDYAPVEKANYRRRPKSVGNSTTLKENACSLEMIKPVIYRLSESVAARMREDFLKCRGIQISVRDSEFGRIERQKILFSPTYLASELAEEALMLIDEAYDFKIPVRAVGIKAINLVDSDLYQMTIYEQDKLKKEQLEISIDSIRKRFGNLSVTRGIVMRDEFISKLDIKESNVIFPISYFK